MTKPVELACCWSSRTGCVSGDELSDILEVDVTSSASELSLTRSGHSKAAAEEMMSRAASAIIKGLILEDMVKSSSRLCYLFFIVAIMLWVCVLLCVLSLFVHEEFGHVLGLWNYTN